MNSLRPWSASRLCLEILLLMSFVNQGLCGGGLSTWSTCRSKGETSSSIRTRYLSPKPRYPPIDEATQNKPRNKISFRPKVKSIGIHMGAEPQNSFKGGSRGPLYGKLTTRHHRLSYYVSPNQSCKVFGDFGQKS